MRRGKPLSGTARVQGEQPFALIASQFVVTDDPACVGTSTRFSFLGANASEACPFADGELRFAKYLSHLIGGIPLANGLLPNQRHEHGFDPFQTIFNGRHDDDS